MKLFGVIGKSLNVDFIFDLVIREFFFNFEIMFVVLLILEYLIEYVVGLMKEFMEFLLGYDKWCMRCIFLFFFGISLRGEIWRFIKGGCGKGLVILLSCNFLLIFLSVMGKCLYKFGKFLFIWVFLWFRYWSLKLKLKLLSKNFECL